MLTLTLNAASHLPLELSGLAPETLVGKSSKQIEKHPIWLGKQQLPLGDLFTVKGTVSDNELTLVGDLDAAVGIGAKMKSGSIRVEGSAGHDIGLGMFGGEIEVTGSVLDNAGAEMHGGLIRIRGSAGVNAGGTLPGSRRGMTGGAILIDGDAGDFAGQRMRRGLIAIRGTCGDFLGHSMLAGTIVTGACGRYPGVEMSRGTICLADAMRVELLPTFQPACIAHAPVIGLIGRELQSLGFENDLWNANRHWQQFNGDTIVSGRGELFTSPC